MEHISTGFARSRKELDPNVSTVGRISQGDPINKKSRIGFWQAEHHYNGHENVTGDTSNVKGVKSKECRQNRETIDKAIDILTSALSIAFQTRVGRCF